MRYWEVSITSEGMQVIYHTKAVNPEIAVSRAMRTFRDDYRKATPKSVRKRLNNFSIIVNEIPKSELEGED